MSKRLFILYLMMLFWFDTNAQEKLDFTTYVDKVMSANPTVAQLKARMAQANARVQQAAGAFDPKLYSEYSQKSFDSKTYYTKWETGIEYKTPSPFTIQAGFQENDGQFLNPENETGKNRLWNVGVKMNVGRGLFTDLERTNFAIASIEKKQVEAEMLVEWSFFHVELSEVYWKWVQSYTVWKLYESMVALAQFRKDGLLKSFAEGDRSAADTLEAHTVVRQRSLALRDAYLKYTEAALKLEAYVGEVITAKSVLPEAIDIAGLPVWNVDSLNIENLVQAHPMRAQYEGKRKVTKQELAFKREQLRPDLALYYNVLTSNTQSFQFDVEDQMQFGLKLSVPLFFRKERGGFSEYKAKLNQVDADLAWTELKLTALLEQEKVGLETRLELTQFSFEYAREMQQLLNYEKRLFDIGESSLFIVNQREYQYLMAEVEWIKSYAEYRIQIERWKALSGTLKFAV